MRKIETLALVDDDSLFQFLTKRVIEETKLVDNVELFSNGLQAINYLKLNKDNAQQLPEVILLDLTMPVMDGWGFLNEYTRLLPQLAKKITTYIVSSSNDPADIRRAETIEAVKDFIIKPISKGKFIDMVQNMHN